MPFIHSPKVFVILLNYNRCEDTIDCIYSLRQCTYPFFHIIVVDNASTDNSEDRLKKKFPDIEIIQTGRNLGYTGGINVGVRHVLLQRPAYILILNNDTLVQPDFLNHLVDVLESNETAAAACGTIYYYPERTKIWYAGGRLIPWRGLAVHEKKLSAANNPSFSDAQRVSFITGCMILLRRSIIEKIGMEDERFFMYLDDIEFSARILTAGYELLYVPRAIIYHKVCGEGESAFKLYYSVRNRLLLINSAFTTWQKLIARSYFLIVICGKLIIWRLTKPRFFKAALYGLIDFFVGRFYEGRGISEFGT